MAEPAPPRPAVDQVRNHAFDGNQEYDNDLPRWWLWLFYLTIVWAVLYVAWYHVLGMPIGPTQLNAERARIAEERARNITVYTEEQLRELSKDPERIAKGKALYASSGCVQCHGADGASSANMPGSNLVDRWWAHGNRMEQILDVLAKGRSGPGGAMPPQTGMSPGDRVNLVIHIVNLNRAGEKPGKAPSPAREKETPIDY
jgi:cytochrome c oxidase cbb3-type subunit 3